MASWLLLCFRGSISRLAAPPVSASPTALRPHTHDSGPEWLARPSPYQTLAHYLLSVSRGTQAQSATSSISASSIYANSSGGGGAGIYALEGDAILINTTISGNSGSGIYAFQYGRVVSTNSTIAHNAGWGWINTATTTMQADGTVFSANGDGSCSGLPMIGSHNVASDGGCFAIPAANQINTDPLLLPLADNGGPTLTHALDGYSPAIDYGDPFEPLPTDQRGSFRPLDGDQNGTSLPDAGAFEYQPPGLIFVDGFESGEASAWSRSVP